MFLDKGLSSFIANKESNFLRLFTLGLEGTSSWHAAVQFSIKYPSEIHLCSTYEDAAKKLEILPNNSLLIVANAYALINKFYISDKFYPVSAFFCDTPPYVIATKSLSEKKRNKMTVATHPAPKHMIFKTFDSNNIDIIDVESTYRAAELCYEEGCESCLTTKTAAEHFNLAIVEVVMPAIPMLWTVFAVNNF